MDDDHGHPTSYMALRKGTPVLSAAGREFGTVRKVLQVPVKNVWDGLIVRTTEGDRFVDAPDVERLYERAVITRLSEDEVAALPAPGSPLGDTAARVARRTWRKIAR